MDQRWAWVAVVVAAVGVTQWASSAEPPDGSRRVVEYTARCVIYKSGKADKCADISPSMAVYDCSAAADAFACTMELHESLGTRGWEVYPKSVSPGLNMPSSPALAPMVLNAVTTAPSTMEVYFYERITYTGTSP